MYRLATFMPRQVPIVGLGYLLVLLQQPALGQQSHTPEGVRLLENKTFDDSDEARREILELYEGLRVTDVCDGMDLIGLQAVQERAIRPGAGYRRNRESQTSARLPPPRLLDAGSPPRADVDRIVQLPHQLRRRAGPDQGALPIATPAPVLPSGRVCQAYACATA